MVEFSLTVLWRIEAPVQAVWDAIDDSIHWPRWWTNVEAVRQLQAGAADGSGAVHRYTWKGVLPYRMIIDVRVIAPLVALAGVGRWHFETDGSVVRYDWHVRTASVRMNAVALAPVARSSVPQNHDSIMREGGPALARLLDARLVGIERTLSPCGGVDERLRLSALAHTSSRARRRAAIRWHGQTVRLTVKSGERVGKAVGCNQMRWLERSAPGHRKIETSIGRSRISWPACRRAE